MYDRHGYFMASKLVICDQSGYYVASKMVLPASNKPVRPETH